MRLVVVVMLAAMAACGRSDEPRSHEPPRPGYGPLTPDTSIKVDVETLSDIDGPFAHGRYIEIFGDGRIRDAHDRQTHVGRLPPGEVAYLVNELSRIDFLNFECRQSRHIDHGTNVSLELAVPGGKHRVTVTDCVDGRPLDTLALRIEMLAAGATQSSVSAPQ